MQQDRLPAKHGQELTDLAKWTYSLLEHSPTLDINSKTLIILKYHLDTKLNPRGFIDGNSFKTRNPLEQYTNKDDIWKWYISI